MEWVIAVWDSAEGKSAVDLDALRISSALSKNDGNVIILAVVGWLDYKTKLLVFV